MHDKTKNLARKILPANIYIKALFEYHKILGKLETEMFFIDRFVKNHRTSVDVGAYSGLYSLYLSRKFKRVYTFEPIPELYDTLLSFKLKNTQVFNVALSSKNGNSVLHIPTSEKIARNAEASLVDRGTKDNINVKKISVACRSLDSFNITDLDFVKIDVEGHELDVIAGSTETIKKYTPTLLVEIEQRWQQDKRLISETFEFLKNLGYSGYFIKNKKVHNISEFDVQRDQLDILRSGKKVKELANSYINNFFFAAQKFDFKIA